MGRHLKKNRITLEQFNIFNKIREIRNKHTHLNLYTTLYKEGFMENIKEIDESGQKHDTEGYTADWMINHKEPEKEGD